MVLATACMTELDEVIVEVAVSKSWTGASRCKAPREAGKPGWHGSMLLAWNHFARQPSSLGGEPGGIPATFPSNTGANSQAASTMPAAKLQLFVRCMRRRPRNARAFG